MDAYEAAIDAEEKARARLQSAVRAEEVARQALVRARARTWDNKCPREEAVYASRVAETKQSAKEAVAATYAVAEEQGRDRRRCVAEKKTWASVVSGQPPKPKSAPKPKEKTLPEREFDELLRWAQEQDGGGCSEHDLIGCRECAFNSSGRCHSELHEYYGGTEW